MSKDKPFPRLDTEDDVAAFVETADLSDYDMSGFRRTSMEALMKEVQVNVRLPEPLYQAVKAEAARQKVPYSRYVRSVLEQAVRAGQTAGG